MISLEDGKNIPYILQTKNLEKDINGEKIISNLNLHLFGGEIYGLLGPNGSGKTAVMKMLMSIWKPTNGVIEIFGEKLTPASYDVLRRISAIIDTPVFCEHLSGEDNLKLHSDYMGIYNPRSIESVLELLELSEMAKKPVKQYSQGMKQRLGIARAILTKSEILLLDEPSNGLDPIGIKQLQGLFCMLRDERKVTIMISTHVFSEVETIADRIGIISHGKLLDENSIENIRNSGESHIELKVLDIKKTIQIIRNKFQTDSFSILDGKIIRLYDHKIVLQELAKELIKQEIMIESIENVKENLERYYMKLLKKV